jgi:antitoxin VapB
MSLNIKNPETYALAARVASLTGETMTEAVTTSLRERLAHLEQPDAEAEALLAIGRDCAARLPAVVRQIDHGAMLYDEQGLPK